jgi:hypothetical protein
MVSRGLRLYGILNLVFAAAYAVFGFVIAPSRELAFPIGVGAVCTLLAASGVGLLAGASWSRRIALLGCWTLLIGCAAMMVGLVASSAYLRGVYGGFGRGAAVVCLLGVAFVLQFAGLLPIFELRFLSRADVRQTLAS